MKIWRNKPLINVLSLNVLLLNGVVGTLSACAPRIAIDAPKEPIMINMNVKIEHEIRIKVDKELDHLLSSDPTLF